MTLTIIQRQNLGTFPAAPVFASGERLFYRASLANLRLATLLPPNDVLWSAGLNNGTGDTGYKVAQKIGNYYVGSHSHNGGFGIGPKCNFVEMSTGATIQLQLPDAGGAQTGGGSQGRIDDRVCFWYSAGGFPNWVWSRIPPNHAPVLVGSSISSGNSILELQPSASAGRLLVMGAVAAGFSTLQSGNWSTPGINAVLTTIKFPRVQAPWTDIVYPDINDRFPWYSFVDGGFIYQFCKARVAGNYVFGITRAPVGGGNGTFYNLYNNGSDVQPMNGFSYAYYHTGTRYLTFTTSSDGMRVYLVNMAKFNGTVPFPWSTAESITVDNWIVNNNVMGLHIEPPFIYVAKGPGGLFGSQYIKIFASALVQPSKIHLGSKPKMRLR
jgi:hypothetical protein